MNVNDIRLKFKQKYKDEDFVLNKDGTKVIEIINATFVADEPLIFGALNEDYIARELEWYKSMSLNVNDIPGNVPKIWQQISSSKDEINSNYGWCIYSEENYYQFMRVMSALLKDKNTRQALMIYQRPSMHIDCSRDGMSDFICTTSVQYFIRNDKLECIVTMRSNDVWAGYRNDFAWQKYVHEQLLFQLSKYYPDLELGTIYWNAGSLHMYERNFHLLED